MRRPRLGDVESALLRVCFAEAGEAATAWQDLAPGLDVDRLDTRTHGLLPLLHDRLVEMELRPPVLGRLHGVRRRLWVLNERKLQAARAAMSVLAGAGVAHALAGRAALLVGHLRRADLAPLPTVDVVAEPGAGPAAVEALSGAGWCAGRAFRDGYLLDVASVSAARGEEPAVLLRWSSSPPYADAVAAAVPAEGGLRVLGPADLLVQSILDGDAGPQWAADVLVLLRGPVDWRRVEEAAGARSGRRAVGEALGALGAITPLPEGARELAGRSRSGPRWASAEELRRTVRRAWHRVSR